MKKTVIRIVCAIIATALIIGILTPVLFIVFADEIGAPQNTATQSLPDEDEPADTQTDEPEEEDDNPYDSATDAKSEMDRLQSELNEVQNAIDNLEEGIEEDVNTKAYYEQQANLLAQQIEVLKTDIAARQIDLQNKQMEHEAKILEHQNTKKLFEDRLAAIYMVRNNSDIEVLLGATSYSESSRYDENLQHISLSDTQLMEKLKAEEEALDKQAQEIEQDVIDLEAAKAELDVKSADYATAIAQVNTEITQQQAQVQAQEVAYEELAAQFVAAEESWREFITSGNNYDFEYNGATFGWPLPGYYALSSDYNEYRLIYGVPDIHRGIDMPAPSTAVIYAAAEGYVTTTGMHWSYGNAVKIDHGSSLISLYAHMSAVYVKNGDYVYQGQPIGQVGTTGNSTGNHLHFEVNLGGQTVDPRVYLAPADVSKLYHLYR